MAFLEVRIHWLGYPNHAEVLPRIKDTMARRWVERHKHKPPVPAEPPSKQSEAEHLAVALRTQIGLCTLVEHVEERIARVRKGYSRRQGDKEWWVPFESMI